MCDSPEGDCEGSIQTFGGGVGAISCDPDPEKTISVNTIEFGGCADVSHISNWMIKEIDFDGECDPIGGILVGSLSEKDPVTVCCAP